MTMKQVGNSSWRYDPDSRSTDMMMQADERILELEVEANVYMDRLAEAGVRIVEMKKAYDELVIEYDSWVDEAREKISKLEVENDRLRDNGLDKAADITEQMKVVTDLREQLEGRDLLIENLQGKLSNALYAKDDNEPELAHYRRMFSIRNSMNKDEGEVFHEVSYGLASKLMGEGRAEYGPLNLDSDTRTLQQVASEAMDECLDAASYVAMLKIRIGRITSTLGDGEPND